MGHTLQRISMLDKSDSVILFVAGLGIGATAALLLTPGSGIKNRRRLRKIANRAGVALKDSADDIGASKAVKDLNDQAKETLDAAASAAKATVNEIADKSSDVAHRVGKTLETGGRQLQDA
jgi:gas vesicle protein